MVEMRRARTRMKSLRSLIAIGGAAAIALGVAQATGTLAVSTDAVNSTGAQVATGNFFPTPLPASIDCDTSGTANWDAKAKVTWPSAGAGYGYKITLSLNATGTDEVIYQTGTSLGPFRMYDYVGAWNNTGPVNSKSYRVFVQTVHIASGSTWETRQVSSGSVSWTVFSFSTNSTHCTGSGFRVDNQGWENNTTWDPTTPDPNGSAARGMAPEAFEMDVEQGLTADPEVKGTTTQVPTTTPAAPTTSTQTPTTTPTTEVPTTTTTESATPTTTTTVAPATTTTTTTPPKPPVVALSAPEVSTSGATATLVQTDAGAAVVVTDSAGDEISSTAVSSSAELKWDSNGQLWIVDGGNIYRVSSFGTATTVTAADAPADIAAWIDGLQ
ncbi:hypothetical protein [Rhodococcus sp. OK302]|uniref:hypothetical protein n=1 Tax=Rhodococcus sp. OK302 TaxID=1882769 RepID=UPI000B9F5397|nr:hypothetical protein [Rhodococcus sp. OK302]OYD66698.1 hypothetical protein BDB13_0194 [Rhodococcus sp. OK302]